MDLTSFSHFESSSSTLLYFTGKFLSFLFLNLSFANRRESSPSGRAACLTSQFSVWQTPIFQGRFKKQTRQEFSGSVKMASRRSVQAFEDHLKCHICEAGQDQEKVIGTAVWPFTRFAKDAKKSKKSESVLVANSFLTPLTK